MHVCKEFSGVMRSDMRVLKQSLKWVWIGVEDSIGVVLLKTQDSYSRIPGNL